MAIASQYLRGRRDPDEPYYFIDTGDYVKSKNDKTPFVPLIWTTSKSAGATLARSQLQAFLGAWSLLFDTTDASDSYAYIVELPWPFNVSYPFRLGGYIYLDVVTGLIWQPYILAMGPAARSSPRIGFSPLEDRQMIADYADGYCKLGVIAPLLSWFLMEIIEISDTQYYVEYGGAKYGPFTKPSTGISDRFRTLGDTSSRPYFGQCRFYLDELKCYKREDTYDPAGAIAPTEVLYWETDFESAHWDVFWSITTGNLGVMTRSSAKAHSGSYSLMSDSSAGVDRYAYGTLTDNAYYPYPPSANYPIIHEFWLLIETMIDDGCVLHEGKVGTLTAWILWLYNGVNLGLDVEDATGKELDVYTFSTNVWYKIQVKELNDTQFQVFVDDVQVPAGKTYSKKNTGLINTYGNFGDPSSTRGQQKVYWDDFKWYRRLS